VDNNNDATPLTVAKELVTKWDATFRPLWLILQSNRYGLRWIEAKRILPSGGNSSWKEYPEGAQVGSVNEEQGVLQCAPIVKLFAGLTEGVQGRVFMPSPPEDAIEANIILAGYTNAITDLFDAMISFSGAVHDMNLAVYSKKTNQAFAVTTATLSNIIGSVGKRRQPL